MEGLTLYGLAVLVVSTLVIVGGVRAIIVLREMRRIDRMIQKFVPKRDVRWPDEQI